MQRTQRLLGAAVISFGLFSPVAHGAEGADSPAPASRLTIGGGVAIVPAYAGSDDYRAFPLLVIDYQHDSGMFISSGRGVGYQAKAGAFSYSAALGISGGRSDHKRTGRSGSDDLRGMGEIKRNNTVTFAGSYDLEGGTSLSAKAVMSLNRRDQGNHYEFGVRTALLKTDKDTVTAFAVADYADEKYMRTYFGVTKEQSLASGYAQYTPKAGLTKAGLGLNWDRKINDKWSVRSTLGVGRLLGDAADSPLTKKKTMPMFATSLNYSF